jgi:topoisomerase-4 subunit A
VAYIKKLLTDNFLYYASYVIMDRAIPELDDGLKPVQRRILHSLFEMDDGKFHKVANVVGHCMKYHPHGDASIASALVYLANRGMFIETQGNFGNPITGDEASAPRYIECRCTQFAKEIFYRPKITRYVDSYDGRNKEPVVFPAKIPVVLMLGAEGIAVGMSTKILPHNPVEVLKAEIACLQGKPFALLPDFPTGGIVDCSEYAEGTGKVRVRALLDTSDPKKIVIKEIPFGSTTESLIASIEEATRLGHLKIASISDFTTDKVEIEIKLARGVYAQDIVDALYAFTECERSISCNCLVIRDEKPTLTTVSEIVRYHAGKLLNLLRQELELERDELRAEIFARTLERIFIEERIYKSIESKRTSDSVIKAVIDGFKPFSKELKQAIGTEDVEHLLKIPIRRISLYDIERAQNEMEKIQQQLSEIDKHLNNLVEFAIDVLKTYIKMLEANWPRRTKIKTYKKIEARAVARHDIALRYDAEAGYVGTEVSGEKVLEVSAYDKILVLRKNGIYTVLPLPDRIFVGQELLWIAIANKELLSEQPITMIYKLLPDKGAYIKRTIIDSWLTGKDYSLVPENAEIIGFSTEKEFSFQLEYKPKPRIKKIKEIFNASRYPLRGKQAQGIKLTDREIANFIIIPSSIGKSNSLEPENLLPINLCMSQNKEKQNTGTEDNSLIQIDDSRRESRKKQAKEQSPSQKSSLKEKRNQTIQSKKEQPAIISVKRAKSKKMTTKMIEKNPSESQSIQQNEAKVSQLELGFSTSVPKNSSESKEQTRTDNAASHSRGLLEAALKKHKNDR